MKITLCGSTRFLDSFHYWNVLLSQQGHIVYSVCLATTQGVSVTPEQKLVLDAVHMGKIANSDAIFVITTNHETALTKGNAAESYIGESTAREVYFAKVMDKKIIADRHWGPMHPLSFLTVRAFDWFKREA